MTALSGRTYESLQAEADYLGAQQRLDEADRYMLDAMSLQVILTSLTNAYPDHARFLVRAVEDAQRESSWAEAEVGKAREALERAKANWENQ